MKRLGTILAAAALVAVGSPTQASALDFGLFCGGNNFNTCAAVQITNPAAGVLQIDVLNLSGFDGTPENTVFTAIGWRNLGLSGMSDLEIRVGAAGSWENASDYGWSLGGGFFPPGESGGLENDVGSGNTPHKSIASTCINSIPGPPGSVELFTPGCEDGSINGYQDAISFRFNFTGMTGNLADADILIRGQNVGFGDDTEGSLVCDTATNCEPTETPEPGTMILLGTGLAGMLAVRRRKNQEV